MIRKNRRISGISPIVAVILMVVLAIVLAGIVTGALTSLVSDLLVTPAQAGVTVDQQFNTDTGQYTIDVLWESEGNVNEIYIIKPDNSQSPVIDDVGESLSVSGVNEGEEVQIIGLLDGGEEQVVRSYTVN